MFCKIKNLSNLNKLFNNLSLNGVPNNLNVISRLSNYRRDFSVSAVKCDLMEFFDNEKNWGEAEVKSGRSWKKEELRLKSNTDLHKLWYVLLKERNMLLTMEEEAKRQTAMFPNPERLDKVQDSMEHLETVIRERNVAYHQLETGETGERPRKLVTGAFGLRYNYKSSQYTIPKFVNKKWRDNYQLEYYPNKDTEAFLLKYREKAYLNKKRQKIRDFNHVIHLMKRFPNMDMKAVKEQYPDVDIEKAKASRRYRTHFVPQ